MWNLFKKSKEEQIENNESVIANKEWENMCAKANGEAVKIYTKIYCFFNEHLNELKKGDNFILLKENHAELDDEVLNESIYYNSPNLLKHISELQLIHDFPNYFVFTITIKHDDIIELYDIRFRVNPSPKQINNGNEICVTVIGIDKNIYKII